PNFDQRAARISFKTRIRSGNNVLKVESLSKSFGNNRLFSNINFEIKRGERVALIGPNGTGKTTLFKIILEKINPDEGKILKGINVNIGYYDQEQSDLDESKTIVDEIWDVYP
ncbi:MAG TPA: thiamine ABC transporter substrate-binding protein, partial [Clostridiaceae bacterium]|nr:thiamine ABC transporter substrate-binding protein [Clostridiaceae bacterium]